MHNITNEIIKYSCKKYNETDNQNASILERDPEFLKRIINDECSWDNKCNNGNDNDNNNNNRNLYLTMCILSSVIYNYDTNIEKIMKSLNIEEYTIHNIDNILIFGFFMVKNKIIIAIKGSSTLLDYTVNLDIIETEPEYNIPGKVHRGFYKGLFDKINGVNVSDSDSDRINGLEYRRIDKILDIINNSCKNDEIMDEIYITGHSLGAGYSTILYSYLKNNGYDNNNHSSIIKLITFGSPKIGNKTFSKSISDSIRIVNETDIVTYLPFSFCNYSHINKKIHIGERKISLWSIEDHRLDNYFNSLLEN